MTFGGNDRFADDVSEVGADSEVPIDPDGAQRGTGNETSTNPEESTEDANNKPDNHKIDGADVRLRDREKHYSERPPRSSRINPVVIASRTTACPIMRRMETAA